MKQNIIKQRKKFKFYLNIVIDINKFTLTTYKVGKYIRVLHSGVFIEDVRNIELVARPESESNVGDLNGEKIYQFLLDTNKYANEIVQSRQKSIGGSWI